MEETKTIKIEIFFSDLIPEKQKEINEKLKIDGTKDCNWDVFPISILEFEADEYLNGNK